MRRRDRLRKKRRACRMRRLVCDDKRNAGSHRWCMWQAMFDLTEMTDGVNVWAVY